MLGIDVLLQGKRTVLQGRARRSNDPLQTLHIQTPLPTGGGTPESLITAPGCEPTSWRGSREDTPPWSTMSTVLWESGHVSKATFPVNDKHYMQGSGHGKGKIRS